MAGRVGRVFLLILLIAGLATRNPLLLLIAVLLIAIFGSSWLWGRYCLSNVTYARDFSTRRVFCGEEFDLWINVANAKPLPLSWLKSEDEFPKEVTVQDLRLDYSGKVQRQTLVNVFSLRWYERVRRRYRLRAPQRGAFDFGPVLVSSGDLFGFRERRREGLHLDTLLVYPKLVPLSRLGLQAATPLGDFRAERRIVEDPLRLSAVREYAPGDSIRHVHWKATARRGALQTKVFDPSATQHLIVCVNTQTLDTPYSGVLTDRFETAIVVTASIAYAALDARRAVGIYANSGPRESHHWLCIPASRRSDQLTRILESLAELTYLTLMTLEKLLHVEAPNFPYGATIAVVSTIVTDEIISALLDLKAAGHPIALIFVGDPMTVQVPDEVPYFCVSENWTDLEQIEL